MDTIVISDTKTNEGDRAALDAARIEMERTWGINPSSLRTGHEYIWHEGTLYCKSSSTYGSKFFTANDGPKQPDAPEVLCPCGSVLFSLRYGNYEIRARCTACGTEDAVYDG